MIHVSRAGQSYGPYSTEVARAYFQTGNILPDDLVWSDEDNAWLPAQKYRLLTETQLPAPPGSPPPPQPDNRTGDKQRLVEVLEQCQTPSPSQEGRMSETRKPVGGWLLFLCICLTLVNPLAAILYLNSLWIPSGNGPFFYSCYLGAIGIWYFVTGLNLWKRAPFAVVGAKSFMVCMALYPLFGLLVIQMDSMSDALRSRFEINLAYQILPQLFWSTLWYQYLVHSKRVRETFPEPVAAKKSDFESPVHERKIKNPVASGGELDPRRGEEQSQQEMIQGYIILIGLAIIVAVILLWIHSH